MERNRRGRPRHPDVLTPAEWRVLDALRDGGTNAEIAARLGLSAETVKTHISNMLTKLELRDRRALVAWRPEGRRGRLGALFALPAALWSLGRPLVWVGAGAAALGGVVVVVVALVALEAVVEGDSDPSAAVAPPTDPTPAAPAPAPDACATPTDPTCIHAVYIGAPGDYAHVVDIPSAMRLNAGPGGTYHVDAGLEVTVVTAARLPGGWTRFYLEPSPVIPPVSASRLIPPVGTTYTFTVSDEATAASTVTYNLKAARPFPRPPSDGKPEIGATVVTTGVEVQDCSSGIATNPTTNTELVADCESLLGLRDTIRGTGRLNWTAAKAMSEWMGVTVSGTPQRVTALDLADLGLDGELSGLLGNLTGLTTLDLSGNPLTGMLPSKLAQLDSLTSVSITGTDFEGCAPPVLRQVATNDVTHDDCGAPADIETIEWDGVLAPGTYRLDLEATSLVFDIPPGEQLIFKGVFLATPDTALAVPRGGDVGIIIRNASQTASIGLDVEFGGEWVRKFAPDFPTGVRADTSEIFDRIVESMWEQD